MMLRFHSQTPKAESMTFIYKLYARGYLPKRFRNIVLHTLRGACFEFSAIDVVIE